MESTVLYSVLLLSHAQHLHHLLYDEILEREKKSNSKTVLRCRWTRKKSANFYEPHKCNSRKATYCRLHNSSARKVSPCLSLFPMVCVCGYGGGLVCTSSCRPQYICAGYYGCPCRNIQKFYSFGRRHGVVVFFFFFFFFSLVSFLLFVETGWARPCLSTAHTFSIRRFVHG